MNLITQILPVTNIIVDLDATSKKRVFEQAWIVI